jgi:hypothetical protein
MAARTALEPVLSGPHLLEELKDQDEDVKIERNHRPDPEDPTPGTDEVKDLAGQDRNRQHGQRYDADLVGRQEVIEGKTEVGQAGQHGRR